MGSLYGFALQVCFAGSLCGFALRVCFAGLLCGFALRVRFAGSLCGFTLRVRFAGSLSGFALWAVLDVTGEFSGQEIATLRDKVLGKERNIRGAYYDEVEGRERWEFVKEFNNLISGQTNIITAMGAA